jgi:hypothetical protein
MRSRAVAVEVSVSVEVMGFLLKRGREEREAG